MTAARDIVMPKLGLTMTEGVVARWVIAAGNRFAAGEPVAVIETDKIAYDLEAPSAGVLQEIIVTEGNTVPVGATIGRWDIADAETVAPLEPAGAELTEAVVVAPASAQPVRIEPKPAVPTVTQGERTLATPYARRLARDADIDLGRIVGSGPRGRIKAIDVTGAIADPRTMRVAPAPHYAQAAPIFSAGIDVDVSQILALTEDIIHAMPPLQPRLLHFVILAASRAIDRDPAHELVIGLAPAGHAEKPPAILKLDDCRTLRAIMARSDSGSDAGAELTGGTLWVAEAQGALSFISGEPPPGWSAYLGVGSVRAGFASDADGRPVKASAVSLIIACRPAEFDAVSAQALLGRIRQLLEKPSYLLIH